METVDNIQLSAGDVQFRDHFHWTFYGSAVWKCALLVPALIISILIAIKIFSGTLVTTRLVMEILYPAFVALIMIFIWTFLIIFMQFRRLTPPQKSVTWTFSQAGVAVKDKAGNEIKKPWSEIKAVKFSRLGARVEFRPFGSFWVPDRWFEENQIMGLKALAKSHCL